MEEIKCPKCGTIFTIDEANYDQKNLPVPFNNPVVAVIITQNAYFTQGFLITLIF